MTNELQDIPFFTPDIGEDEIAEVVDSIKRGWITTGGKSKRFEEDFAAYIGGNVECVAVNSATAGLHLALEAIGIGPDDEVIIPDMTFTATGEVIRYFNATPIFVDMEFASMNIDTNAIEEKITSKTRAIIVVHFAGLSVDMDPVIELARKYKLRVIEDAAHSLPTTYKGKRIGTLDTDATVFSFYATKTITTGEGGMVVTTDSELAARCRTMRLHGFNRDVFDRYTAKTVSWRYDVVAPGFKYNMGDIAASLGIHQLKKADKFQKRRQEIAGRYAKAMSGLPLTLPASPPTGDQHSWHLYVIRVNDDAPLTRDVLIEQLGEKGIKCSVHFIPLHEMSYWRETYDLKADDFPNAAKSYSQVMSLPLFTQMTDDQVDRVVEALRELLQ